MKRLERDRLYHCREISDRRTGHFSIKDSGMTLELFDYDRFFHIERGAVLHIRLQNNRTVSLHHTACGGFGRSTLLGDEPVTTYFSKVHANTIVVGDRPWQIDDPILRTWFRIPQAKKLVWRPAKVRQLASRSLTMRETDTELFDIRSRGLRIRCWYGATGSVELGLSDWWPIFQIESEEPRQLDNYLNDVHRVLRFFSAAAGFQLTPSEICISPVTHEQFLESVNRGSPEDHHQVEYMWGEARVRDSDLHCQNSFVCALDAREIRALAACLKAWLDRSDEWEEASTLMMGSLGLHDEVSGDRLLMACRWLEKIPGAISSRILSDQDLVDITAAAAGEAVRHGLIGAERRIEGALRSLRSEPNRDRFARLVGRIEARFPDAGLDESTVEQLMRAQQQRGTIAHGVFEALGGQSLDLQRSFTAVEALSYLLTISDLPITPKGRKRATSNRVVRDYRYSRLGG